MDLNELKNSYRQKKVVPQQRLEMYKTITDADKDVLLLVAASFADFGAIEWLLENGANANIQDEAGKTPLMLLAPKQYSNYGGYEIPDGDIYKSAVLLLDAKASALRKDENGSTCYHIAAKDANVELLQALSEKGARISMSDEKGNNGLHLVCIGAVRWITDMERTEELIKDRKSSGSMTEEMEKNLLKDIEKIKGIIERYYSSAKIFYDAGVDPEDKNNMLESAKVLAVRTGYKKLSALLEGNFSGDASDGERELFIAAGGMTLCQAVLKKDYEAVSAIVKLGVDVNCVSDEDYYKGMTPLSVACSVCDPDGVELLIKLGADVNFKTGTGLSAVTGFFVRDLSVRLKNVGEVFDKKLPDVIIKKLIAAGMDINGFVDDNSDTFLNYACLSENGYLFYSNPKMTYKRMIAESLINNGADVNISNKSGQTPLISICAMPKHDNAEDIILSLVENGAEVDRKDINGNTALHYISYYQSEALAKTLAEYLFDFGDPQVSAVNNNGKTALEIATERNNEALVKFLLTKM